MNSKILPLHSHTWLVEIRKVTENGLQIIDYCKCTTYNAAEMQARVYSVRILNESELSDAFVVVKPYEMKRYVYAR